MSTMESVSWLGELFDSDPIPSWIDGGWHRPEAGSVAAVLDPASGSAVADVLYAGESDVDRAVAAADAAFAGWSRTSGPERAEILERVADRIEDEAETLSRLESLDVGKTVAAAAGFDIPFSVEGIRYFADIARNGPTDLELDVAGMSAHTHLAPIGPSGFVLPWNFPFMLLWWNIAPAIAAGNTVVVKPSEVTPLSTLYAAKLATEAGLPAGVFNVVVGTGDPTGTALINHPRIRHLAFTGSPEVGRRIAAVAGERLVPCKLELGGKGAAVIFPDTDLAATAEALAGAITLNTGQVCCTATRWIVHEDIRGDFLAAAEAALRATKVGDPSDPEVEMGPLVSAAQLDRVLGYRDRGTAEGAAEVVAAETLSIAGGEGGYFVSPHLLEGDPDNVCFREEVFGPTAYVTSFKDEEEALRLVNSIDYGLANSVWSADLDRARRVAEAMVVGNSWINAHNVFAYGLPYGGVNRSGLGGGVNSRQTYFDYLRHQTVARPEG